MPPARGSSRHGSNTILKAASEPSDSIKTRTIDVPSTPPPQHDRPPSPSPPPRHLMELFPPLPGAIYVHCLQRHAYLVETLSQPSCVHSILETNRHQVLAHVVMEILDASSSDIAIASLTLPPTLRFVLQLLILHEQRVWPNETPTPDLVVGLCGILVLLWRVTARVDALLAHVDTTNGVEEALPLDEINANLKLRLALLTEEWAHAIGVVRCL
ncbi:hypothetical protein DYB28_000443 [Aphanomyces astaci]|uniref:Uncharacterized protein n=1 Tax=Aphanomyces astaci TaxID=112090 RepID=A0A397BPD9_APHAT|nr:hypothetical protein DYB25_006229 [Aphanomyces astaci]RLO07170.1 hypothetical protein DYB28_000443 [Aphanomyces astaci]